MTLFISTQVIKSFFKIIDQLISIPYKLRIHIFRRSTRNHYIISIRAHLPNISINSSKTPCHSILAFILHIAILSGDPDRLTFYSWKYLSIREWQKQSILSSSAGTCHRLSFLGDCLGSGIGDGFIGETREGLEVNGFGEGGGIENGMVDRIG
ncbi:hypothetical protein O181_038055 [Austropuccinia psidii MF-1]|uniref:Uncharacterized protein n=1 Tax=Austropuccinia psidii MF-1 TaxID=1389203 RepID=A0A9Q3HDS0_9BASI|nr:hypothetical protein [Austropuccinia psidii MF-1]